MRKLQLDFLKEEKIGVSKNVGEYWAEAAIICLINNGHQSGVKILVDFEDKEYPFQLEWTDEITEKVIRSWGDFVEAAEYGATAIAALLISTYRFSNCRASSTINVSRLYTSDDCKL